MFASVLEVWRVTSDGFITTQFPAAIAPTSGAITIDNG